MTHSSLYVLCGIPFAGKTTLAKKLAEKMSYKRVDLDEVKKELLGSDIQDEDIKQEDWDRVYQEMYKVIRTGLMAGKTVVHDTGNFTKHERDLVKQIAKNLGYQTTMIFVDTPQEVALQRLRKNKATKERFEVSESAFWEAVNEMEVPSEGENVLAYRHGEDMEKWILENFGK